MIPPTCHTVRDGTIKSIPAADLVKGDIVLLVSLRLVRRRIYASHRPLQRTGDKTPADLLIFASSELKMDNSSLTGESEPQERFAMPNGSQLRPVEAENLVWAYVFLLSSTYIRLGV